MINKNLLKEFSSMRFITILTPDTFTRKMIIVSCLWNTQYNEGEIAIKQVGGLNNLSIGCELDTPKWNNEKRVKGLEETYKEYLNTINKLKFLDCKKC